jgi:PPOX class probable F420-dependent enzyme
MRLSDTECQGRLAAGRHGVLATMHPTRGVDLVPVVYALLGSAIVIPVDTVKAKNTRPDRPPELQRQRNLDGDPRCSLLVEHYDEDWSRLWWVRVHAAGSHRTPVADELRALENRFEPYRRPGAVPAVVVLTPTAVTGWQAGDASGKATERGHSHG